MKPKTIFIAGKWQPSLSKTDIDVMDPSTGEEFTSISAGHAEDIDLAVKAARQAFEGDWGHLSPAERSQLLYILSQLITKNADELVTIEAKDTGKPISQARADIKACARYFEFYAGAADKFHGDTIPYQNEYLVTEIREARGVTGHIIPWNYPAQMFGRTLGPALATGNATVIKPAEEACLSCIKLLELVDEAGFPAGAVNLVTGRGEAAGAALSSHPDVDFISFTGSPEVGTLIQIESAKHHRPCVLELGGKSPQIIFDDANMEAAIATVAAAIVQNGGQTCSAGSRVLIQKSIFNDVITKLQEKFNTMVVGRSEDDLSCGPMISAKQKSVVERFLAIAEQDDIPCLAKATLSDKAPTVGYYVTPTLFGPVPEQHDLAQKEVFGPVLSAIAFDDEEDAIRIANGTDFGLVAGVWTENGGRQIRLAKALKCGQVFINNYGAGGGVELPFGGVKQSGHGREKGFAALHEFTIGKTIIFKHD